MKILTQSVVAVVLLGTLTLGMSADISAQLDAISIAPDEQRVELVNELKTQLQAMTPQERHEVMDGFRSEIGTHASEHNSGVGESEMMQTQMREHSQMANADEAHHMQGSQFADQHRGADVAMDMDNAKYMQVDSSTMHINEDSHDVDNNMFSKR